MEWCCYYTVLTFFGRFQVHIDHAQDTPTPRPYIYITPTMVMSNPEYMNIDTNKSTVLEAMGCQMCQKHL